MKQTFYLRLIKHSGIIGVHGLGEHCIEATLMPISLHKNLRDESLVDWHNNRWVSLFQHSAAWKIHSFWNETSLFSLWVTFYLPSVDASCRVERVGTGYNNLALVFHRNHRSSNINFNNLCSSLDYVIGIHDQCLVLFWVQHLIKTWWSVTEHLQIWSSCVWFLSKLRLFKPLKYVIVIPQWLYDTFIHHTCML